MGWKYGERIKYIREQTNITQDDLALKMGVKKAQYQNGKPKNTNLSKNNLEKWLRY